MLVFASSPQAGPLPAADDVEGAAGASAAPALSTRFLDLSTATAAASAASGSALAMEIIKEAGAGNTATELPRQPGRDSIRTAAKPAPSAPSKRPAANAPDDPWGLRGMGKSALQWVKEAVPWLRGAEKTSDADQGKAVDMPDWSASPLEAGQAGRGERPRSSQSPGTSAAGDPLSAVGYGNPAPTQRMSSEENLLRIVVSVLREVLEHPMTWLVISLFVIGGIVVKRIDRRPTK